MTRPPTERSDPYSRYARTGSRPASGHQTGHQAGRRADHGDHRAEYRADQGTDYRADPGADRRGEYRADYRGAQQYRTEPPTQRRAEQSTATRPAGRNYTGTYGVAARGKGRGYQPRTNAPARRGRLARFVETYGWRAYAIPVLVVATALCAMDLLTPPAAPQNGTPAAASGSPMAAPRDTQVYAEVPEDNPTGVPAGTPADALPPGGAYATRGTNAFTVVPGTSAVTGSGPLQQYTVEIEGGVTANGAAFAAEVERILADPRGWGAGGRMSFQRVDNPGVAAFRVSLTSTMTVRQLCGYTVRSETSCYNGGVGRAVINDARWVRGAVAFNGDLPLYHQYLITHEVGHSFGHHHELCGRPGGPAPVMMQQTLSTGGCTPNPWPYPDGSHEVVGPPAPSNLPVGN